MQKIYDFGLTIKEYSKNVKNNDFPEISKCPCCNDKMIKNGFYSRYVITSKKTYVIYIRRYRCKHCGVTLSILPSFLLPRFQRSLRDIFNCIYKYLSKRRSEEHTSELQSRPHLVCRLLLEKKKV